MDVLTQRPPSLPVTFLPAVEDYPAHLREQFNPRTPLRSESSPFPYSYGSNSSLSMSILTRAPAYSTFSIDLAPFHPRRLPTSGTTRHLPMFNAAANASSILLFAPRRITPIRPAPHFYAIPLLLNVIATTEDALRVCGVSISMCPFGLFKG